MLLLLLVVAGACNSLMAVGSKAANKSSEYVESYRQHDSFRQNPRDPSRPNSGDGARQGDVPDAAGSRRVTKIESHGLPEDPSVFREIDEAKENAAAQLKEHDANGCIQFPAGFEATWLNACRAGAAAQPDLHQPRSSTNPIHVLD